jgi:hypothetical protein
LTGNVSATKEPFFAKFHTLPPSYGKKGRAAVEARVFRFGQLFLIATCEH